MSKNGTSLGADIYELWSAGTSLLPTVAEQYDKAYGANPASVSYLCARGGPIGIGPNGPGAILDTILDQIDLLAKTTASNIREVGAAMEWVAIKQYQHADQKAKAEYDRKKTTLGE